MFHHIILNNYKHFKYLMIQIHNKLIFNNMVMKQNNSNIVI